MAKQDDYARYTVRLPSELYQRVQSHAEANERSVNAEIISLLELGVWEADQSRMERGLEPLREMTDGDREFLAYSRKLIQEIEERKRNPPPEQVDLDVPFFADGPTQREIFDKLFEKLDAIEKKLDEK
jgi:hypothetical protein